MNGSTTRTITATSSATDRASDFIIAHASAGPAAAGPAAAVALLRRSLGFASVSGQEGAFTELVHGWAEANDLETDLWQAHERDLFGFDPALAAARHLPLAGRPTLVVRLAGNPKRRSVMINAHADVVPAPGPERWTTPPFEAHERDGRIYGRGACDVKGPLAAALTAMLAIRRDVHPDDRGDVLLELIPGEEDCVGLGTLTSVARGHRADAAIILEPTENVPCCASRAGTRFRITARGRAVHGTVKWLGRDAIAMTRRALDALDRLEQRWNDRAAADPLFTRYPITRPITVDRMAGGDGQGMTCDACTCEGYLELLPGDDLEEFQRAFVKHLNESLREDSRDAEIEVEFTERYRGHQTPPGDPLCVAAAAACDVQTPPLAFNSGCEAGLRAYVHGTPTIVWGPGSLNDAHAIDESIAIEDMETFSASLVRFIARWGTFAKADQ